MLTRHLLVPAGTLAFVAAVPGLASAAPTWNTSGAGVAAAKATAVTAPATITASASGSTVTVNWGAGTVPTGAARYWVERLTSPGGASTDVCSSSFATGTTAITCSDTGVANGTYNYRVRTRFAGAWESTSRTTATSVTIAAAPLVVTTRTRSGGNKKYTFSGTGAAAGTAISIQICTVDTWPCAAGNDAGTSSVTPATAGNWGPSSQSTANLSDGNQYYVRATQGANTSATFQFTTNGT